MLGPLILEIFNWHPKNKHSKVFENVTCNENKLVLSFCCLKGRKKSAHSLACSLDHIFSQSVNPCNLGSPCNLVCPRSLCWVLEYTR